MDESLSGAELIAAERQRQIEAEGYTPDHDAGHRDVEHFAGSDLRAAAECYLSWGHCTHGLPGEDTASLSAPALWPWDRASWKPSPDDQVRDLVKAGALIAAEIDRLQAAQPTTEVA